MRKSTLVKLALAAVAVGGIAIAQVSLNRTNIRIVRACVYPQESVREVCIEVLKPDGGSAYGRCRTCPLGSRTETQCRTELLDEEGL